MSFYTPLFSSVFCFSAPKIFRTRPLFNPALLPFHILITKMSVNLFLHSRDYSFVCVLILLGKFVLQLSIWISYSEWLAIYVIDIGKVCLLNISTERHVVTMKRHSRYRIARFYRLTAVYITIYTTIYHTIIFYIVLIRF